MTENPIRQTITRRGLVYSYHYHVPTTDKPTIIFLLGFPSTHSDWAYQISFFSSKGYGIIAPDLLGYGDTSAPEDVGQYKGLLMAQDIIDIVENLGIKNIIGVAHDWGCFLLSRLLNVHHEIFRGAAFLAIGYMAPSPSFDYHAQLAESNRHVGYDVWGFWEFFAADDAPAIIEKHGSIIIAFPDDPSIWKTHLAPLGKAREWIEENKQLPRADFWTEERKKEHQKALLKKGLQGPCNWYKAFLSDANKADEALIKQEAYHLGVPAFYGGARKDYVCLADLTKTAMAPFCSKLITEIFDTSHWIMFEAPDELNEALGNFFDSLE